MTSGGEGAGITHITFYTGVVADFIEVVGRHAWFGFAANHIQYLPRKPANFPHRILTSFVEDGDLVLPPEFVFRITILVPWWFRYVIWYRSSWRQRIDRSHGSGEFEGRERVV